jgi:hypothetical protein
MTKRIIAGLFAVALATIMCSTALVNSSGKAGYTGSPGEVTCATSGCHSSFPLNSGIGSVAITVNGMTGWQYVPGQVYTVNVTVAYQGRSLFGFGFEALQSSGANAGTLTAGAGSHTLFANIGGNLRTNMTHLSGGGVSPNSKTFTFTWSAPATNVGNVTFYVSGLCANGTGGTNDDYVYNTSQVLTPLVPPSPPLISSSLGSVICQNQTTILSLTPQDGLNYTWFLDGSTNVGAGNSISVSSAGCYTAVASGAGGNSSPSNQICVSISNPSASFSGLQSMYCISDAPNSLQPSQSGGNFSGSGISTQVFDPQVAGAGTHTITYSITDNNGCSATTSESTVVYPEVNAFFDVPATLCSNSETLTLTPVELGGVFSGPGVDGTSFSVQNAGAGNIPITYLIANEACQASYTSTITVFQAPNPTFSGLNSTYCANAESVVLIPTDYGGNFSGDGVTDSLFTPSLAGIGVHSITYTISNNECTSTYTAPVAVSESFEASFSGLPLSACTTDGPISLVPAEFGGEFSGSGVSGNFFNPQTAGVGTHLVIYNIGSGDCAAADTVSVVCIEGPVVSLTEVVPLCANNPPVALGASPEGGVFSGGAVGDGVFDPATANIGLNTWSYQFVDSSGCSVSASSVIEVKPLPDVGLTTMGNLLIVAQQFANYVWTNCSNGEAIFGATSQSFAFSQSGTYSCTVEFNGCSATSECQQVEYVSVAETTNQEIKIYPNPNAGSVFISGVQDGVLRLFNMTGQMVAMERINSMQSSYSNFPSAGNYIAEVTVNGISSRYIISVIPE